VNRMSKCNPSFAARKPFKPVSDLSPSTLKQRGTQTGQRVPGYGLGNSASGPIVTVVALVNGYFANTA